MDKRPDFKSFKKEVLQNAKVREEYEAFAKTGKHVAS
jgi:hypothetical protein